MSDSMPGIGRQAFEMMATDFYRRAHASTLDAGALAPHWPVTLVRAADGDTYENHEIQALWESCRDLPQFAELQRDRAAMELAARRGFEERTWTAAAAEFENGDADVMRSRMFRRHAQRIEEYADPAVELPWQGFRMRAMDVEASADLYLTAVSQAREAIRKDLGGAAPFLADALVTWVRSWKSRALDAEGLLAAQVDSIEQPRS